MDQTAEPVPAQNAHSQADPARATSVAHGLYQIPPGQTMAFEQIAGQFPMTTAQAIADANPAWPRTTVFSYPQAIYLPPLTVVADSAPSSGTLEAIAWYCGTNLTCLAADNAGVAGLFKTGSQVKVTGGPIVRTATVSHARRAHPRLHDRRWPATKATRKLDFIDVDVDGWTRTLFAAIDDILSPPFTAGLQLLARYFGTQSHLATILGQKQALADAAATLMIPGTRVTTGRSPTCRRRSGSSC